MPYRQVHGCVQRQNYLRTYNEAVQGALRMIRYGKKDIVKQLKEKMQRRLTGWI